jgi:predicted alpha/beta hydrolase family esterase
MCRKPTRGFSRKAQQEGQDREVVAYRLRIDALWKMAIGSVAIESVRMRDGRAGLRVIVLHGTHRGPDTNWFPWLHTALNAEGIEVFRPRFPTPQGQSLEAWLNTYDLAVKPLPLGPTILVGHSLGAAFALRLVERAAEPVDGLFLAAGFIGALGLPDYDTLNHSFFAGPFDWAGIRERKGSAGRCWAGDNDPYVPRSRSQEVADRLNTPLETVLGGGHLNSETGFNAAGNIFAPSSARLVHKRPNDQSGRL